MEAAADAAECLVAAEAQAVLARKCPVQRGSTVKRQFRMSIFELCAGQLQRFVQLVQPFQIVVQPQQAAVAQAVVAFFLVQGLQQLPQLCGRELAGVHLQVQYTAVHRYAHRNFGRGGLQIAEGVAQVHFTFVHQGGHALFQQAVQRLFVRDHVLSRLGGVRLQPSGQQPVGPALGAGVPQQACRGRAGGGDPVLSVQEFGVSGHGHTTVAGRIQIELHHGFQRDLVQQQAFRVQDGQLAAQLRQHIAAEFGGVGTGEKQAFAAQRLQSRKDAGTGSPLQPPQGVGAVKVIIVQPVHGVQGREGVDLHTAPAALHRHGDDGQALLQGVAAQRAGGRIQLHQRVKDLTGQRQAACRGIRRRIAVAAHHVGLHALLGVHLPTQQLQQLTALFVKGVPAVHKGQKAAIAGTAAVLHIVQQGRDALDHILPPPLPVGDAQPQPRLSAGQHGQLRFQLHKAGVLRGISGLAQVLQGTLLVGLQQLAGLLVGDGGVAPPLAAEQHFQPGSIAVLPGGGGVQPVGAPHHARDGFRGGRCLGGGVLGRILQQQRANVLAVGAVAVLVVGTVAGGTDKAAVLPQPDLCIKTVGSIALHQRRDMAYAILVGGAAALQDAAAVFLGTLKYHFAQQCADLVCVHGRFPSPVDS